MSGPDRSVAVVTDSAASLPASALERSGVRVVPMSLILDGTLYPDGELAPAEVLARSAEAPVSTSAPSPGDFLKAVAGLPEQKAVIATVSSKMSASFEAASTAAGYLGSQAVRVVDTRTAAGAEGLVVLAAAAAAARGLDLAAVAGVAEGVAGRVHLVASLENLDRLAQSGRVPGIAARAGRTFGVRPLFEFRNGRARARRPALSPEAALDQLMAACARDRRPGGCLRAAVLDAQAEALADELEQRVREGFGRVELYRAPFSSVMVTHTGPNLIGLAWWWADS